MFCHQCGKEINPNARFCSECGAPVSQPAPSAAPPSNQNSPYQQVSSVSPNQLDPSTPPKPRRSRKPFLLVIPALAVVLAVLTVFNFTALAARFAPDYALSRGFHKLNDTLKQQQSDSDSMALLPVLSQYLQAGTLSFSGEFTDPNYGDAVTFSGELLTNQEQRAFLLQDFTGTASGSAMNPLSLYLSPEAFAVNSLDAMGENGWFGLYLDRPVSEQIPDSLSLDPTEIARLQAQIDGLTSLLNAKDDPTAKALAAELTQVFDDFLDSSRPSVSTESVRTVNSHVDATVLTYHFTMSDLAVLASNFYDVLLKEEYVSYLASRSSAGIADMMSMAGSSLPDEETWAAALEESRQEIVSALREQAEGEVTLCFALASDGTLVKISCTFSMEDNYGSAASMTCTFAMDPACGDLALLLQVDDANGSTLWNASLVSTTTNEPNNVNQTLSLDFSIPYYGESVSAVLSNDWDPTNHDFNSCFLITSGETDIVLFTADGTLDMGQNTLDLELDAIHLSLYSYWSDELTELMRGSFHLSAEKGASVPMPDFENIFQCEMAEYFF